MVARMMRWPRPPAARKFRVRLVVRRAEGLQQPCAAAAEHAASAEAAPARVAAEVRWKGPKASSPLSSLRRTAVRRNRTREAEAEAAAVVACATAADDDAASAGDADTAGLVVAAWEEEFESTVTLAAASHREHAAFQPWELAFSVFTAANRGPKIKPSILGTASLNLADYASAAEENIEIILPLSVPNGSAESAPSLHLTLGMVELRAFQETSDASQRSAMAAPLSPSSGDSVPVGKDEVSVIRAGLRKVKILTDLVSTRRSKKTSQDDESSEEKCYVNSDGAEYPCDIESLDDDLDDRAQQDEIGDSTVRKSFSYGSLQSVNYVGGLVYAHAKIDGEHEDWIYYSHRKSDAGYHVEGKPSSTVEETMLPTVKRSILPWRKRKLSLRSLKAKGEPLLKKAYGEEGGDDIDYDRRLLTSSDGSVSEGSRGEDGSINGMVSEFGDDNFVVGNWELKEIVSRDGHLKLSSQVFFASIDQRSERAAGESACTALVAVIADWFQSNQDIMPIQSQFDSLIREGSLEWRNLCENLMYRERFPDKHFDLETVLQAKIRPLTVSSSKSFIGFFQPEGADDMHRFDFLDGAMSFDSIWDEISKAAEYSSSDNPNLYIVSWNDHFFLLKVERDAYYIIDTLGERLYEGCSQAYILKFDNDTMIHKLPEKAPSSPNSSGPLKDSSRSSSAEQDSEDGAEENILVSKGKESCKEYIKSFLAAIPIRELQVDIKKGLMASTPLHHRLQIEFHYTASSPKEITSAPQILTIEAPFEFSWPEPPPAMEIALAPAVAVV
uniref:C2 NT-type domain-containing protein n=1 Tax=Oryza meridionalis TaxID=40149 RepID=A0A0E0D428_9ORYZ